MDISKEDQKEYKAIIKDISGTKRRKKLHESNRDSEEDR